jgi:hypothetical protein
MGSRYNAPFCSTNPAPRLCEPEGLTAAGLENSLAEPVRGDIDETRKNPPSPLDMHHQRPSEWFTDPRIS